MMHYYQVTESIMKAIKCPLDSLCLKEIHNVEMPHAAFLVVVGNQEKIK